MRTTIVARDSWAAGSAAMRCLTAALTVLAFGCMEARAGVLIGSRRPRTMNSRRSTHHAALRQPHTRREQAIFGTAAAVAALAVLILTTGTALASNQSIATCRLTFHVRVRRLSSTNRTSRYRSSSGTVACNGVLGAWFMSGGEGPSSSAGSFGANISPPRRGGRSCRSIVGSGTFRAAAPEFTFSIPPATQPVTTSVPMNGSFQLSTHHQVTGVTAFGTLGPPPPGFIDVSGFSLSGPATLVPDRQSRCGSRRWTGTLSLEGTVWSSYRVG